MKETFCPEHRTFLKDEKAEHDHRLYALCKAKWTTKENDTKIGRARR